MLHLVECCLLLCVLLFDSSALLKATDINLFAFLRFSVLYSVAF